MTYDLKNQPYSTLKTMTCKRCGDDEDRVQGYCSNHCKDLKEVEVLREENRLLKELAINFIAHSEAIRAIQYKCFADEYLTVKDVGIAMPSYQTTRLHNKLKKIARPTDDKMCGRAISILMKELEGGE